MNQPQYSMNIFLEHGATSGILDLISKRQMLASNNQFSLLELGPGDSLFTAVIAKCFNFKKSWLVDTGNFAKKDMRIYHSLITFLQNAGYKLSFDSEINSIDQLLKNCGCEYLTDGVNSLKKIPSDSIDYCFSNAVLEHIPKQDFSSIANELFRILKQDGVSIHRVDLKDHLGGALNNLRFSELTWEGRLFSKSGFYTNRIRYSEMIRFFTDAGFTCTVPRVLRWKELPTALGDMDATFSKLPLDELLISGFDVVMKKS